MISSASGSLSMMTGTTGMIVRRMAGRITVAPALLAGAALGVTFALSLFLFLAGDTARARRVLFYPDQQTGKLVAEEHFLPRVKGTAENARRLLKELLLGPASFELGRLLPRSVQLRSVMLHERVLYVDFSADLALDATSMPLGIGGIIQGVANNLFFNFRDLRGVQVLIHGQIPQIWGMNTEELSYSREMVR